MPATPKCMTCSSFAIRTPDYGLCMKCYVAAKKRVEICDTTWQELEDMGLIKVPETEFDKALREARERKGC